MVELSEELKERYFKDDATEDEGEDLDTSLAEILSTLWDDGKRLEPSGIEEPMVLSDSESLETVYEFMSSQRPRRSGGEFETSF